MSFEPEFVAIMTDKMSKKEVFDLHKSIKTYTKKTTKKKDLQIKIKCLLTSYEILYNKLSKSLNPDSLDLILDKTKVENISRDELYGIHTMFRKSMKHPKTKQDAINNIIAFAKQIHYFNTY